ncbi:MAG: hypothetical protein JWR50_2358 [Mucilaginibacter sp.]|nr:hypothetical protein [Mucilaginibacter sp.]
MKYQKLIFYSFFGVVLGDALYFIGNSIGYKDNSLTPFLFVFRYSALFIFIYIAKRSSWNADIPRSISILLKVFLTWNIITVIRGFFLAVDYWDIKFVLGSSMLFFLVPLTFFVGKNIIFVRLVFNYVLKYLFAFGFLVIPLALVTNTELYSRLMIPISVFIVLAPYLKPKWQKLILLVAITSIIVVFDFRSNIIKISISLILLIAYYFRRYILLSWIKTAQFLIFIIPLVFLSLAVSGTYNLFAESSKTSVTIQSKKYGSTQEENLTADTRTFLYVEVFKTLSDKGTFLIGEGASGKYKSDYFDDIGDNRGRYGSEVGFLNILLYSGIIGFIIYGLILLISSYYAVYRSKNFLCKMFGMLLICRWLLFFVEEYTNFDLNTFFTWLLIGLVCNAQFRNMTDRELKLLFKF